MSYLDYCKTEKEKEVISTWLEVGSKVGTARKLSKDESNVRKTIKRIVDKAALQGYAPESDMIHTSPDTHFVKGTSTLYKDGEIALQWVKTDKKMQDQYEAMHSAVEALKEEMTVAPLIKSKPDESGLNKNLINQYIITDSHIGMAAWGEETRDADWSIEDSENCIINWFKAAIEQSPNSEKCIFTQLGDFMHYSSMDAKTPASGHILDSSCSAQLMIRVSIRVMHTITEMLLQKHKSVHIQTLSGNHDPFAGAFLRESLDNYYSKNPRVTVDVSPDPYQAYEFGSVGVYCTHGHKKKLGGVSSVFVAKFREMFGRTKYSYSHQGHYHHEHVIEDNLMICTQHPTLSPMDSYSSGGGYSSESAAEVFTYHKDYGRVSTVRITRKMVM